MAKYKLTQKTNADGTTQDVQLDASCVDLSGYVPTSRTINSKALSSNITLAAADVKALPNYSLSISTSGGNPREVRFVRVNYSTFDGNNAAYFRIGAMCSHGNGSSYTFLEDIIIGVSSAPAVTCTIYKQVQNASTYTIDSHTVHFGDVYWVVDTTNKYVDFYIIGGQYATINFTPFMKIGATISDTSKIVQYTSANYYSSGTRVWNALGNGSLYATTSDLSGYLQGSKYNASNPSTFIGYTAEENVNSGYQVAFRNNNDADGICWSKFANMTTNTMTPSQCTYNGFFYVSSSTASLSGADANPFIAKGLHVYNYDFRILTTAFSDQWLQQIATDFRSDYVFIRRRQEGNWLEWIQVAPASSGINVTGGNSTSIKILLTELIPDATTNVILLMPYKSPVLTIKKGTTTKYNGGGPVCLKFSANYVDLTIATNASGSSSSAGSVAKTECYVNNCIAYYFPL